LITVDCNPVVHHGFLRSPPLKGYRRVGDGGVGEDVMIMVMVMMINIILIMMIIIMLMEINNA